MPSAMPGAGSGSINANANLDLNQLLPSETNTSGTQTTNGTQNTGGTQDTSGTQTSSINFDQDTHAYLLKLLRGDEFSKSAAFNDAKGAADYAMKQSLQQGMPGISSAAHVAGGYNNTTADLLTNDLSARAQAASSSVLLDTITKYANANASNINSASGLVANTSGRTNTNTGRTTNTGITTNASTTTNQNNSDNGGGQVANIGKGIVHAGDSIIKGTGKVLSGNTVICTRMYIDGHISAEVYKTAAKRSLRIFKPETLNGYRFWAVPFVALMLRNKTAYKIGKFVGVRWSLHLASQVNIVGFLLYTVVVPICYVIGVFHPVIVTVPNILLEK